MATELIDITEAEKKELDECAYQMNLVGKELAYKMLDLGKWAARAKNVLSSRRDGAFADWVQENCQVSLGYVYGAIRAHERFGDFATGCKIDVKALLLLSSGSVPDDVRQQAIEESETKPVTAKRAKELIDANRTERNGCVSPEPSPADCDTPVTEVAIGASDEPGRTAESIVVGGNSIAGTELEEVKETHRPQKEINAIGDMHARIRFAVECETDGKPDYIRLNIADFLEDLAAELRA